MMQDNTQRTALDEASADDRGIHTEPLPALAAVDGWPINIANQAEALEAIIDAAHGGAGFALFTLNVDHLVKLRNDAAFRRAYREATFVTADGEPVARLARRTEPNIERTTGADLVLPLAEACADAGLPVYLFGTTPDVLARASARLILNTGGRLEIAGTLSPAYGFDPESAEADRAIDRIAASGAKVCFVALGAPKQELFAARAKARSINAGFICIGAGLDFLAGDQVRAPLALQRAGLEWLWRLGSNPRRLALRYAQCGRLLAELTFAAAFGGASAKQRAP
jgi:exopolysaccharide biosynthesis WecB/TagA/CpsF family protein